MPAGLHARQQLQALSLQTCGWFPTRPCSPPGEHSSRGSQHLHEHSHQETTSWLQSPCVCPLQSQDSHVNTYVLLKPAWGLIYCHSHAASPIDGQCHAGRCLSLHHQHPVPPVPCWGFGVATATSPPRGGNTGWWDMLACHQTSRGHQTPCALPRKGQWYVGCHHTRAMSVTASACGPAMKDGLGQV